MKDPIRAMLRTGEAAQAIRRAVLLWTERRSDRQLGIETRGFVNSTGQASPDDNFMGVSRPHRGASPYEVIRRLLAEVKDPQSKIFVDFGCGPGRAVVLASLLPFRKVIGVELLPGLCRVAEQNLQITAGGRKCGSVEISNRDARDFEIPEAANVFFFANPFEGDVLRPVLDRIQASLSASPRAAELLFFNAIHLERHIREFPWIRLRTRGKTYAGDWSIYDLG